MKPLTAQFRRMLDGADFHNFYTSAFTARRALVMAALNAGWTLADAEFTFLDAMSPVRELWISSTRHEAPERRLARDWQACLRVHRPAMLSASDVRQRLGERISVIRSASWPGRTGRTDRDVLLAVLEIATRAGTYTPGASERDVAQLAGVTRPTVARSLRRLCASGWIARQYDSQPDGTARRYEVLRSVPYDLPVPGEVYLERSATPPGHEVWVRLGKAAHAVWSVLDTEPRGVREIARLADVNPGTSSRQLPNLRSYRLARSASNGWTVGPASLDDVARAETWVEFNSKVWQRQFQHAEDRAYFAEGRHLRGKRDAMQRAEDIAANRPCRICHLAHNPAEVCADVIMRGAR
jgi:hypothetical protein